MDTNDHRARALDGFVTRVRGVRPDQWDAPTPCTEWNIRDLVNHVTGELFWSVDLAAGRTIREVGDRYDGDLLGDDPVRTVEEITPASVAAFRGDHAAVVDTSMGPLPVDVYLTQMLTDALVHSWDLAVATGQDTTLDPAGCQLAYERTLAAREQVDAARGVGVFGPEVPVDEAAPAQDKLLGLLGRDPAAGRAA